jgi:hypothetical protein
MGVEAHPPSGKNKNPNLGAPASLPARKRLAVITTPMGLDPGQFSSNLEVGS